MAKSDLEARPIYHRKRDSIEAHLTIVFAALAVSRWVENQTGWSIRKLVKTARRYRTIQIQAGDHIITAADPYPTTSAQPQPRSTTPVVVRTSLIKLGSFRPPDDVLGREPLDRGGGGQSGQPAGRGW